MKRHTKKVHEKIKDIICEVCAHAFSTISNKNAHIKYVHLPKRKHICEECSFVTISKDKLKNHMSA